MMTELFDEMLKDAYNEGKTASADGYWTSDNPYIYDLEPEAWKAWMVGLLKSDHEIRRIFYEGFISSGRKVDNPFHPRREGSFHAAWKSGYQHGARMSDVDVAIISNYDTVSK